MIEITLLFLGSIIGAGFATGAEIVTFFGAWQLPTWLIAVIVGLCIFGMITLEIVLFYPSSNDKASHKTPKFLHLGIVMIYLTLFTAMTAGIMQITNFYICLIALLFSAIITLFGIERLSKCNVLIVSAIIVLIISTALPHLSITIQTTYQWQHIIPALFWAVLYAGLNCFMFPELIKAIAPNKPRHTLVWAGLLTAICVTILLGLILSTIKATNTTQASIPLLAAAPNNITMLIILLAILTSQYTTLFAITKRLQLIIPTSKEKPRTTVVLVCLIALIGSFCGFNRIIQYGYPAIGALTCFYLLFSFWQRFSSQAH